MIFRQICSAEGDISYLIADPVTRNAALVDAGLQTESRCLAEIRRLDLKLLYVIETHLHESHLSAAGILRRELGAGLVMHKDADMECVDRPVADGDVLYLGEERLDVIFTPGHSPCSISLLWRDRLFTGHLLLAGRTGSCDRSDADPARLYYSIKEKLFSLPDETLIYPGRCVDSRRISCIAEERKSNPELNEKTPFEAFLEIKHRAVGHESVLHSSMLERNRQCI